MEYNSVYLFQGLWLTTFGPFCVSYNGKEYWSPTVHVPSTLFGCIVILFHWNFTTTLQISCSHYHHCTDEEIRLREVKKFAWGLKEVSDEASVLANPKLPDARIKPLNSTSFSFSLWKTVPVVVKNNSKVGVPNRTEALCLNKFILSSPFSLSVSPTFKEVSKTC